MADTELLALSYLPFEEAIQALDDQKLQQELIRRYYPTLEALTYLIQMRRPDLIAVSFNLNIGTCYIHDAQDIEAVLEAIVKYKPRLDNLNLIRVKDKGFDKYLLNLANVNRISTALNLNPQIKSFSFNFSPSYINLEFITKILTQNQIQNLNISKNNFSLHGIPQRIQSFVQFTKILEINTSLTSLDLSDISLDAKIIISLSTSLIQNRTLKSLSILLFQIYEREAFNKLGEALTINNSLTQLNLTKSKISWSNAHLLFPGLIQNQSITDLNLNTIFEDSIINLLETYKDLRDLILNNKVVKSLDLSGIDFSEIKELFIDILARNNTLTALSLNHTSFATLLLSGLVDVFQKNWNYTSLNLSDAMLERKTDIQMLDDIVPIFARSLAFNSVNLKNLVLDNNNPLEPNFIFKSLRFNTILISLSLARIKLPDKSLIILSDSLTYNKSLKYLNLSNELNMELLDLVPGLTSNQGLVELDLSQNKLDNSDALMIVKILTVNHSLTKINLLENNIDLDILASIQILLDKNL